MLVNVHPEILPSERLVIIVSASSAPEVMRHLELQLAVLLVNFCNVSLSLFLSHKIMDIFNLFYHFEVACVVNIKLFFMG